jgi:hypothetical protein
MDEGKAISVTHDGSIFFTGGIEGLAQFGKQSVSADSGGSLFIGKINQDVLGIQASASHLKPLQVFPNPASTAINLAGIPSVMDHSRISIYNLTGKELYSAELNLAEPLNVRTLHLPDGMYMLRLSSGEDVYAAKFLIEGGE